MTWTHDTQALGELIRTHVLPRLADLEMEIHTLRKAVYPWVQHMKENGSNMNELREKREFFKVLDEDTIRELLELKAKYSNGGTDHRLEFKMLFDNTHGSDH
ncbi:hypothetical protein DSLPV1_021 [Dishui lake phycodnavirus 1]|uniref:hypothetical protein n=1 Tax=Dishui lake phycodnavirus 1 TaxID=2079134 RepID=UPI000CD6B10B|nr:hypothetical protein C5Y57_gp021 [Dishui lake phycodnavirus 1]AUT18992.1 hypothetical protein DSLPV1_021 [Dishui lake phycodnavirus 1]